MAEVSTSVTAFVGAFENGPAEPVRVQSIEDASSLGPANTDGAFALLQFFVNGGTDAWVAPTLESLNDAPFNLLVMPELRNTTEDDTLMARITEASRFCEERGAFFILDAKAGLASPEAVLQWLASPGMIASASANCALYWPDVVVGDPSGGASRTLGPSSTVAGIYATCDRERGVWVAPAGVQPAMRNVVELTVKLSDAQQMTLNPSAVNALRLFPVYGNVVWGARTRVGTSALQSDWKYVPVRRLALYIEQALAAALTWTASEPNGPNLWARITQVANAFMVDLWSKGAFIGAKPEEAFFVSCQDTLAVAFAPAHPTEFVMVRIPYARAD